MHIHLKSRLADRFVAGQSLTAKLDHGLSVAELWRESYDIKSSSHLHSSKYGGIVHRGKNVYASSESPDDGFTPPRHLTISSSKVVLIDLMIRTSLNSEASSTSFNSQVLVTMHLSRTMRPSTRTQSSNEIVEYSFGRVTCRLP